MDMRKALAYDAVVLVAYALVANPAVTGIAVHEWIALGALVVIVAYTAMTLTICLMRSVSRRTRLGMRLAKAILDVMLVVTFTLCCVSGLMVSGDVLPALGLYTKGYYFWDPLHAAGAKLLLALLLVHVVANWKMVIAGFRERDSGHDE